MGWYNGGTVTATNNSGTLTGVSTAFIANVRVGDGVTITGSTSIHEVTNITSETQLTFSPVYAGTTGSGKAYAIVPVQGYPQALADQAKSLILSFGNVAANASVNALMGVTGAADRLPYYTSASAMAVTTFTAAARTLLDDTTVAAMRTTLGLKTSATADLIGTVSQSAGVPTGAVIERGYNANGHYTKWADGTMICRQWMTYTSVGAGAVATGTWTFPVGFSATPNVNITAGGSGWGYLTTVGFEGLPGTTGVGYSYQNTFSSAKTVYLSCQATGLWF